MSDYENLLERIKNKTAKIGVIGLGYVGLPLALLFAKKGYVVTGFVRNENKRKLLESGKSNLSDKTVDSDLKKSINLGSFNIQMNNRNGLSEQDVLIVCLPTPVTKSKIPDLTYLKSVAKALAEINLTNKLVINESTVAPLTTTQIFGNLSGISFLACSPERVDPGNKTKNMENITKIVGGKNKESSQLAKTLYKQILNQDVFEVSSMETAEMSKMLENTYRAVNIALVNEFARLADALDLDILEIIEAAKSKWSFQAHLPGIGVGGHCIPVDPYYILKLAKDKGVDMKIVRDGLLENEEMAGYVASKVFEVFKKGMSVLVYGITYKKDINDVRESPVIPFCKHIKEKNIPFGVYDPFLNQEEIEKMGFSYSSPKEVDIFVVGTDHSALSKDYKKAVGPHTIVIDGRNFFLEKVGKKVLGVGRALV